jgi:hypothetical protein
MKTYLKLTFLTILSFVVIACNQTNDSPVNKKYEIHAKYGKCLDNNIQLIENDSTFTTIEYSFKNNVLSIKHLAAGFNCCFDYLLVNVSVNDNIITIKENDINPNCDCLCLRDISYNFNDIEPGTYHIIINEPYLPENDSAIEFEVELKENSTGIKRFKRSSYPWF